MSIGKALYGQDQPPTPPLTPEKLDELRKSVPHCTLDDIARVDDRLDPKVREVIEKYLNEFARPPGQDEKGFESHPCLHCGFPLIGSMVYQLIGGRGGFQWGYVHGHGWCKECRWPTVGHHFIKDDDGKEVMSVKNFLLQVHPSNVSLPGEKEKDDAKDEDEAPLDGGDGKLQPGAGPEKS